VIAGEKVHIRLNGANATTVLWVFDDAEFRRGNFVVEYSFRNDSLGDDAVARRHRIAAFYHQREDQYESAMKVIQVDPPVVVARIRIAGDSLRIGAPDTLRRVGKDANPWMLDTVQVATYDGVRFSPTAWVAPDTSRNVAGSLGWWAKLTAQAWATVQSGGTWAELRYTRSNRDTLVLLQHIPGDDASRYRVQF
jgi:hypothetical protein